MTAAYLFDGRRFAPLEWRPPRTLRWVAWHPGGEHALLVGNGGTVLLFDGRVLRPLLAGGGQNLRGAAWSPDGDVALVCGNRGAVFLLQGESLSPLPAATAENLRRVAWHPGGEYALLVGNGGTVLRFDRAAGALAPLPGDRAHTLRSIAFHPGGGYALVGAYASRWAGYPRPHALYRCDGRYLQALLTSEDEDDLVAVDFTADGLALACGYAWQGDGTLVNKALLYDGSRWRTHSWPQKGVVLGGGWRPGGGDALLLGERGLALRLDREGAVQELESGIEENIIGPFWRPDGSAALVLRGPGENVYTV